MSRTPKMNSKTAAASGKSESEPMQIDSAKSSSLPKNGGRKSLLERLKPDTPPQSKKQPDAAPKEPKYLDVTAAFFGRHRRQKSQVKSVTSAPSKDGHQQQHQSMPPPPPPRRHQGSSPLERPLKKQKLWNPPDEPRTPDALLNNELRKELDQSIAAEGSQIYRKGAGRLNDLHEEFKSVVADISVQNDRVLVQATFQNKNIIKPLSEMSLKETIVDSDGTTTLRQVHVGKQLECIYSNIKTLEADVDQLWVKWEVAERKVQNVLASMTGRGNNLVEDQGESVKNVQDSLDREMKKYEKELETILRASHEAVRISEKDYTKAILGVMSALLQQYLLGS